jgi:hypothetical protein
MNKNDFRNPLIQSGAVLLFVFLLISIVANSGPNGMLGSISALFSGLISAILFLIALFIAIIISVAILIGLFIAALSINSVDKARDMFHGLMDSLRSLYSKYISGRVSRLTHTIAQSANSGSTGTRTAGVIDSAAFKEVQARLTKTENTLADLQNAKSSTDEQLVTLHDTVTTLQESSLADQYESLEQASQDLAEKVAHISTTITAGSTQLRDLENKMSDDRLTVLEEIAQLQKKTSVPAVVTGILSYIDLPEDRDLISEKAEEAVARGMTYAQIDAFFKSTLKPEVHKVLSEHPRLTKDFLRSVKKKFA